MALEIPEQPNVKPIVRRLTTKTALFDRIDAQGGGERWSLSQRLQFLTTLAAKEGLEFVRAGGRLRHPGRPIDALDELPGLLPQEPAANRAYWRDEQSNANVGLLIGVDLIRSGGRYYLVEANVSPALRPERRKLYDTPLDPFIQAIVERAVEGGIEHVVMIRGKGWSEAYRAEFDLAASTYGIRVTGAQFMGPERHWLRSLPSPLPNATLYVLASGWPLDVPSIRFLHQKWSFANWTRTVIDRHPERFKRLAYIPTYREPVISTETDDPAFPNLVLKLASSDKGMHVAMGRFSTPEAALDGFGIDRSDPQAPAAVFNLPLRKRLEARFGVHHENIFQPFIAPERVNGKPRVFRLNVFVSPGFDLYLSAHGKIAQEPPPGHHPEGLTLDPSPFVLNFAKGADYGKPEPDVERELVEAAAEFGDLVRTAIRDRFMTAPDGS